MSKTIRIGVVGAGAIGQIHIDSYRQIPGVEVAAFAEKGMDRAKERAKVVGVDRFVGDWHKLLKDPSIDAIDVCTPNYLHAPVSIAALKAGKHVICEKPMAMNAAEAKAMVAASKKARRHLMMAFCQRFGAAGQVARKVVDSGDLGKVYHVRIAYIRQRGIPGLGGWFTTKKQSGGGPMLDVGVHFLDLSMWLLGFPKAATASASTHCVLGPRKDYTHTGMWGTTPVPGGPFDVEDLLSGFVRFKNGMTLSIEATWACNSAPRGSVEILGDKGGIQIVPEFEFYGQALGHIITSKPQLAKVNAYTEELRHFVDGIRTGKQPMATGEQGLHDQVIIDALYRSAKLRKEVKV